MPEPIRNCDPACLHPVFRQKAADLLKLLTAEGIPFRLFEGFRSRERQAYLYAQGRTRSGPIVTRARAGESYHQYGLAGDFVLFEREKWTWATSGEDAQRWVRLHEIGKNVGLEPLSFELPHLQLAGLKIKDLAVGQYPAGGDETWRTAVEGVKKAA